MFWAVVTGFVCTWIFSVTAPRKRLAVLKTQMTQANAAMRNTDMEWSEASGNIKLALSASLQNTVLRLLPTMLAAIPAISMLSWMDESYTYLTPKAGEELTVSWHFDTVENGDQSVSTQKIQWPLKSQASTLMLALEGDSVSLALASSAAEISKRSMYHHFLPNPLGYLSLGSDAQQVQLHFAVDSYAAFLPSIPKWIVLFFPVFISISLALHFVWRLF